MSDAAIEEECQASLFDMDIGHRVAPTKDDVYNYKRSHKLKLSKEYIDDMIKTYGTEKAMLEAEKAAGLQENGIQYAEDDICLPYDVSSMQDRDVTYSFLDGFIIHQMSRSQLYRLVQNLRMLIICHGDARCDELARRLGISRAFAYRLKSNSHRYKLYNLEAAHNCASTVLELCDFGLDEAEISPLLETLMSDS